MSSLIFMHRCHLLIDLPLNVVLFARLYLRKLAIRLTSLALSSAPPSHLSPLSLLTLAHLSFPNYYLSPFLYLPLLIPFLFSPPPILHISFLLFPFYTIFLCLSNSFQHFFLFRLFSFSLSLAEQEMFSRHSLAGL